MKQITRTLRIAVKYLFAEPQQKLQYHKIAKQLARYNKELNQ